PRTPYHGPRTSDLGPRPSRLRDKAIPDAAHREEVLRTRRLFLDIPPQAHDEVVDRARVGILSQSPHTLEHRLARDGLALVLDQETQQVGFHQRELQRAVANRELQRVEVDRAACERVPIVLRLLLRPRAAAEQAVDA